MRFIFSVFIMKNIIYKHGKLSIFMILLGFAFLLITDFILIKFRNRNIFHSLLFSGILLFRGIAYPYGDMLTKQIFKEDSFTAPENVQYFYWNKRAYDNYSDNSYSIFYSTFFIWYKSSF